MIIIIMCFSVDIAVLLSFCNYSVIPVAKPPGKFDVAPRCRQKDLSKATTKHATTVGASTVDLVIHSSRTRPESMSHPLSY